MAKNKKRTRENDFSTKAHSEGVKTFKNDVRSSSGSVRLRDENIYASDTSRDNTVRRTNNDRVTSNKQSEQSITENVAKTVSDVDVNAQNVDFGAGAQSRREENEANVYDGYVSHSNTNDAKPLSVDSENGSNFDAGERGGIANRTDGVFSTKDYYDVGEESLKLSDLSEGDLAVSTTVVGAVNAAEDHLGNADDKLSRGADGLGNNFSRNSVTVEGRGVETGSSATINRRSGENGSKTYDIRTRQAEYVKELGRDIKARNANIAAKDNTIGSGEGANNYQSSETDNRYYVNTSNVGGSKRNDKNARSNQATYDGDETAQETLAGVASVTAVAATAAVTTVGNQVKKMRAVRIARQSAEEAVAMQNELKEITSDEGTYPAKKKSFTVSRIKTSENAGASRSIDSLPYDALTPKQSAKIKARNSLGRTALRSGGHVVLGTGKVVKTVAGSTAATLGIVNDAQDMALGTDGNYTEISSKASKAFSDSEASVKGVAYTTTGTVSGAYHGYKGTKKFVKNIKKEIYHKGGVVRVYDRAKRRKQILRAMKYQKAQKTFKIVKAPVGVVGKGFSAQKGTVEKVMDYSSTLQRIAVSDKSANETSASLLESGGTALAPKAITAGKSAVKGTYKMARSAANTKTNIRVAKKTIKTSKSQIKKAKESSKVAVKGLKEAYKAGERGRELAKHAYQTAKTVGRATAATVKAAAKALRESSRMALSFISIGGCALLLIILIVCLILIAAESVTDVFSDETEETATTTETLASSIDRLKTDYDAYILEREESWTTNLDYDEVEIVRENQVPLQWKEALAVYSASVYGDDTLSANEMTEERYETLLSVFKDMNTYSAKQSYTFTIGIGEGISVVDEMEAWGFSSEQKIQALLYSVDFSTMLLEDGGREEIEEMLSISLDRVDAEYEEYKEAQETALQATQRNATFVFEDDMTSDNHAIYVSVALSIYAVLTYGDDAPYPDLTEDEKYELIYQLYTEMYPIEITYKKVTVTFSTRVGRTVSEESSSLGLTNEQVELLEGYLDGSFDDMWEELVEGTGWV